MGAVGMSTQSKAGIWSNDEHNNIIWVQYEWEQVKLATCRSDEQHLQPEIGLVSIVMSNTYNQEIIFI